jgi:hypothetical protein
MAEDPDRLQQRSDELEQEIAETREEWERKKGDDRVPGAAGEQEKAEGGLPPEANYTTSGDEPPQDE